MVLPFRLHSQGPFPRLLWQETPPQHFTSPTGEYLRDGGTKPPYVCQEIGAGHVKVLDDNTVQVDSADYSFAAAGGWRNSIANPIMQQHHVPIIHHWNASLPLWDFHRDNGKGLECTHYCLPSAPQVWVAALHDTLEALAQTSS